MKQGDSTDHSRDCQYFQGACCGVLRGVFLRELQGTMDEAAGISVAIGDSGIIVRKITNK